MPRIKTMLELAEIVKRLQLGNSIRNIHKETGTHRTVIRNIKSIAEEKGWLSAGSSPPTKDEISKEYRKTFQATIKEHPLKKYHDEIKNYIEKGYSFVVIHNLLNDRHECSEITIRRYVQNNMKKVPKASMIRRLEDGVMEVDFGYLGLSYDPLIRRKRKSWVFSARLRKSRKAYREVVFNQKQETFFECHINAFHHFGGVPAKVVPDNLKAAVIKAAFYDPIVNPLYRELAAHYGFLISPCRAAKPQHKGGVENDIKYICNNFWPIFLEEELRRGFDIPRSNIIQEKLDQWDRETANVRIVRNTGATPEEMFEAEKSQLKSLPKEDWSIVQSKICRVRQEWMVQYDNAFYSVPYQYIGEKVLVLGNNKSIRIYLKQELIASHKRAQIKWEQVKNKLHAPPDKQAYMDITSESIRSWAGNIGTNTAELVQKILSQKEVDGLRPARGILSLSKKYPSYRLEAACKRALVYDLHSYRSIKDILLKNLDMEEPKEQKQEVQYSFRFSRNKNYFH